MNCTVIQRRLLAAEQPDQPPAEVKSHLAHCPACRVWQRRLVQLERQIALLPVPPSTAKAQLLRRILGPAPSEAARPVGQASRLSKPPTGETPVLPEPPTIWQSSLAPGPKERGLRKLSLAFALAAALLVFAFAWWIWPHNSDTSIVRPTVTPAQRYQKQLEERLAKAREGTPREQILQLADLAEEVDGEAREMADNAEKLDQWARFYFRVVTEDLMEQARALPPADRPAVLDSIATRLGKTESRATRKAIQLKATAPKSAASFHSIALAARNGQKDLRALIRG